MPCEVAPRRSLWQLHLTASQTQSSGLWAPSPTIQDPIEFNNMAESLGVAVLAPIAPYIIFKAHS